MVVFSLILAHLIADFYLQTDEMVKDKRKYLKKHILHHFIVNTIILVLFWSFHYKTEDITQYIIFPLVVIVLTHLVIDILKIHFLDSLKISNEENLKRLSFFLFDQFLHAGVIISCVLFFLETKLTALVAVFRHGHLSMVNSVLFIAIILILTTNVSGHIISIILGSLPNQLLTFEGKYAFKNKRSEFPFKNSALGDSGLSEEYNYTIFSKHDLTRGKLIGYIERLLVLLLTFYNAYPAIGFIVAAKSIARFKQMDDRDWAEYFLLGTLTSMFLGITFGLALKWALG